MLLHIEISNPTMPLFQPDVGLAKRWMEPVVENLEHKLVILHNDIVGNHIPLCFGHCLVGSRGNCAQALRTIETSYNSAAAILEQVKVSFVPRFVDLSQKKKTSFDPIPRCYASK